MAPDTGLALVVGMAAGIVIGVQLGRWQVIVSYTQAEWHRRRLARKRGLRGR